MASSHRRRVTCVFLALMSLLLGGCVYLRLLQLKLQLGDFEKNFIVDARDGLTLTFNHPVVLDSDMEEFFKWVPESRQRSGTAEKWHFAWAKQLPANEPNEAPVVVGLDLYFNDHKLAKIFAPENFFATCMPKTIALGGLRSLGHGKVDKDKREVKSTLDSQVLATAAADRFLSEPGLLAAIGKPTSKTTEAGGEEWHYQFAPVSEHQKFGGNSGTVYINFLLDPATRKVRVMKGRTMFGGLVFDTTNVGPGATGTMNTALPK